MIGEEKILKKNFNIKIKIHIEQFFKEITKLLKIRKCKTKLSSEKISFDIFYSVYVQCTWKNHMSWGTL